MNKIITLSIGLCFFANTLLAENKQSQDNDNWKTFKVGEVVFNDLSPESLGSSIYNKIIPNPSEYITANAYDVLKTLYFSPSDSIPTCKTILYDVLDYDGISAKSGGGDHIKIVYSTRWIEKSFANQDTAKLDYETRGVLLHELTHAYQLEPHGCGTYGDGGVYWAFIEGMADAVRVANNCFTEKDRPKGGTYLSGYRTTGFFLNWVREKKDPDFLRKFNKSALEVYPWSFEAAFRNIFGNDPNLQIGTLWHQYMKEMGDL